MPAFLNRQGPLRPRNELSSGGEAEDKQPSGLPSPPKQHSPIRPGPQK